MSARVHLIGQPAASVVQRNVIVLRLADRRMLSALPAGMPIPPADPTVYTVYIAPKHWQRVATQVQAGTHHLRVEGWQRFDAEQGGIVVFATRVRAHPVDQSATHATAQMET